MEYLYMEGKKNHEINILLIDDDEDEYLIARDLFQDIGKNYKISWINNYEEGLKEILNKDYDLCLLDYHLGKYNGIDFIKDAASSNCNTPIILLTGQGDYQIDLLAMKAGAIDYLDKRKLELNVLEKTVRYAIERKKSEEKIRYLAFYDQLTNLPNRTLFFDRLQTALAMAKRHNRICAIMFLDIDNFKRINDSLGHSMGDLLIKEVSIRLLNCIRKEDTLIRDRFPSMLDTVARLGGDEFTILLSEIKEVENASKVAERIRKVLLPPFMIGGSKLNITVSIGISIYPLDGHDLETLIKNSDIAMYNAKSMGKNNFQYYNLSMNNLAMEKLNMENDISRALENNELILYYQPLMDLKTKKITSVEALLRWRHPQKGITLPKDFIPIAEETGLIINIGNWVLETIISNCSKWKKQGLKGVDFSINISPKQLNNKNFLDSVAQLINNLNFSPDNLIFEITENSIIYNVEGAYKIINSIRDLGIKIALDDFGSGYASFDILRQFNFDILKIDRSFIKNIPENLGECTIVSSLISIGHSMNLKVIAEGIEKKEQLCFLETKECDIGQGYYFSMPVPEEEIIKILFN